MQHIVMYSGGIGSWAAGMRVAARYGTENLTLLFCDTKQEDEDLYRFLHEGAAVIGVPVTMIADGRTPWEVFHDKDYMGRMQFAYCTEILKQNLAEYWVRNRYVPTNCVRYLGMDWCQKEQHRLVVSQQKCAHVVEAPLFWSPPLDKDMAKLLVLKHGLRLPRLYAMGFQHNNCGGACVKAGRATWATLYREMPDRYRYHADQEEAFRQHTGKNVAILRDRRGGKTHPMTLRQFATQLDRSPELPLMMIDDDDQSCDCFLV